MYGQQKRNIIHKSSTAYEQDHSDQRDELAPFHLDRPLSKPTHWTFVVAPDPPHRTPIAGPIPGVQINARIAEDPQGQARVLVRLPDNWNGRLVVAGAPARAANSTVILPGVITSCRKATPTSHKTRVLLI